MLLYKKSICRFFYVLIYLAVLGSFQSIQVDEDLLERNATNSNPGEEFFTITESDDIIDGPSPRNIKNTLEQYDTLLSSEILQNNKTTSIIANETSEYEDSVKNSQSLATPKSESVWELFKAQVKSDFAPFIIIAEKLGIAPLLKSFVLSLRNILNGAFGPMTIVILKGLEHMGDSLADFSRSLLKQMET